MFIAEGKPFDKSYIFKDCFFPLQNELREGSNEDEDEEEDHEPDSDVIKATRTRELEEEEGVGEETASTKQNYGKGGRLQIHVTPDSRNPSSDHEE